jgi:hypothetical protein
MKLRKRNATRNRVVANGVASQVTHTLEEPAADGGSTGPISPGATNAGQRRIEGSDLLLNVSAEHPAPRSISAGGAALQRPEPAHALTMAAPECEGSSNSNGGRADSGPESPSIDALQSVSPLAESGGLIGIHGATASLDAESDSRTQESAASSSDASIGHDSHGDGDQYVLPAPSAGEAEPATPLTDSAGLVELAIASAGTDLTSPQDLKPEQTDTKQADDGLDETPSDAIELRSPRKFRPTPRGARRPRIAKADVHPEPSVASGRALPICVRLKSGKAGYCQISLLARRSPDCPAEMIISGTGNPQQLVALQDEWFQDFVPSSAGPLLSDGIEWSATLPDGSAARWSLSGRELYVLAPHDDLSGFVSTARLVIGQEHIVLCTAERVSEAVEAIAKTGSVTPAVVSSGKGIPAGWAVIRGVNPRTPVSAEANGDILEALRPLATVQISFSGGIRLERQAWLTGHPPRIRLHGDIQSAGSVLIDGIESDTDPAGNYIVPGWDAPGQHLVSCDSASRSYAIKAGAESWQGWDAYRWSLDGEETGTVAPRPAICGAAVRPPPANAARKWRRVVSAPDTILIGPVPGDVEICAPRPDLRSASSVCFPPFDPVWEIPSDPLRCDRRVARVVLIGAPQNPDRQRSPDDLRLPRSEAREKRRRENGWRDAILSAGRKRLLVEPDNPVTAELWREYRAYARALRRKR